MINSNFFYPLLWDRAYQGHPAYIWSLLVDKIPSNAILYSVKLRETPTIFSIYYVPNKNK